MLSEEGPDCRAGRGVEPCPCEACINDAAAAVPWDAVYIDHFADQAAFARFVESRWLALVAPDDLALPTGESATQAPADLVRNWLDAEVVWHDGYGGYFWLSARHAAVWGRA